MMWAQRFWLKLQTLFRRNRSSQRLNDEIQFHLDQQIAENLASGMSPEEARYAAMRTFGNTTFLTEETRDTWGWVWLEQMTQDLRYGLRMLRKSPGFTAVAVLTLALGIGANTAIFSLLDGLVLRALPVPHPEQLVRFGAHVPGNDYAALSLPMFQELSRGQKVFAGTFAWWGDGVFNAEMDGRLAQADVWCADNNFYPELGAVPEIGRLFNAEEENLSAAAPAQVAVLSYGFWQRHYGGSRDVIGKTLKIEGIPFTIVGVTRKGFTGISADFELEVTLPLPATQLLEDEPDLQKYLRRPSARWLQAAGRLKPGATLEQARAQLDALWPAIRQEMAPTDNAIAELGRFRELQLRVESGAKGESLLRGRFAKPLYIVLAISGIVLLLACVNLASLMLARAASRNQEFGVRVVLGASRARLARQMMTESVALSVAGSVAGCLLAYWASRGLAGLIAGEIFSIPAAPNLSPDWRIAGFTASATILTGVLFGLAPAWRATREDGNAALQQSGRTLGHGTGALGKGLIVTQLALSVVLLACGGLFIRSLEKLRTVDPGFHTRNLLAVGLFAKPNGYKNLSLVDYYHTVTERVSHLPGVLSAGMVNTGIGNILENIERVRISGSDTEGLEADFEMGTPEFFETAGIALLRGRSFGWQDDEQAPRVAIVSQNFAETLFPGGKALGQRLDVMNARNWRNLQIIGVVTNASLYDIRKQKPPTVYLPSTQYVDFMGSPSMLVQTELPPAAIAGALREAVESLGHEYISSIKTVRQSIDRSILQERITAMLSAFFGALALLLAAMGLHGLMACAMTQRTREIGIRMALGAERGRVLKMILRETLVLLGAGIGIGLPCALVATRLIGHMLYGVSPYDPVTLTWVVGALLGVGTLAGSASAPSDACRSDGGAEIRVIRNKR